MLSLDTQVKIQSGKGELEDLLQEGLTRELHLIVSAEDGFSCVRRVFVRELESIYETLTMTKKYAERWAMAQSSPAGPDRSESCCLPSSGSRLG